ncbi:MAG TPA: sulfur transferase domain-containing protein [Thermoanaerobaculia bacterium]|jgi:uncharacterized protein (TIGR01244 family)
MKRTMFVLALLLGSGSARAAGIPDTLDAPNYKRLSPSLAVSGKPSKEALASLKAAGFSTAVDLRQPNEGVASAKEAVEAQGLKFVSVPVSPDTFTLEDAKRIEAVLKDQGSAPVLLYCSSSNRVGAALAVIEYRRGRTRDEAIAEGKKAGLSSSAMEKAAVRVMDQDSGAAAKSAK